MDDDLQRRFYRRSGRLRLAGATVGAAALVLSPAALAQLQLAGGYSGAFLFADLLVAAFGLSAALGGTTSTGRHRALHRLLGWGLIPAMVLSLPMGADPNVLGSDTHLSTALIIGIPLALILSQGALPRSPRFNLALSTERSAALALIVLLTWLTAPLWQAPEAARGLGALGRWWIGAEGMGGTLLVALLGAVGALAMGLEARRTQALALALDEQELAGWLELPADSFAAPPPASAGLLGRRPVEETDDPPWL